MKIEVVQYSENLDKEVVRDKTAVVIDVFRATSVIATALSNGAACVIAARDIEDARKKYASLDPHTSILGGEKNLQLIEGFHFGNSPISYRAENVAGKTVILTTTNGTKAISYSNFASSILVCSLLNCAAVANAIRSRSRDVVIICSGSKGKFAVEDSFCAGMLIKALEDLNEIVIDDYGLLLREVYVAWKENPLHLISKSKAYKQLTESTENDDINFCLQENILGVVPEIVNGKIVVLGEESSHVCN